MNRCEARDPWLFNGRFLILKRWRSDIRLDRELFANLPMWVRIPNIPVQYWFKPILSKALSVVGTPLFMDDATANQDRIDFATASCCLRKGFLALRSRPRNGSQ